MNVYLKAKVNAIIITGSRVDYEGSLTLDEDIMDELNVKPYERVYINSKYGKGRIMTYLLPGKRGGKMCELNGGATHHFEIGEVVHLLFFAVSDLPVKPRIL